MAKNIEIITDPNKRPDDIVKMSKKSGESNLVIGVGRTTKEAYEEVSNKVSEIARKEGYNGVFLFYNDGLSVTNGANVYRYQFEWTLIKSR